MIKSLRAAFVAWVAAAVTAGAGTSTVTYTQTNVLQNVNLQLTVYQQGTTNSNGKKVSDQVTSYTTKNLIADLSAVTGQQFGAGAKLVLSTVYANQTLTNGSASYSNVLSTNLAIPPGDMIYIGPTPLNGFLDSGSVVIDANVLNGYSDLATNVITDTTSSSVPTVTIDTNVLYVTTITPFTDNSGNLTNILIVTQIQTASAPTESVFTNVSSSIDILYGGSVDALYPVTNYLTFSAVSPEIVVENGFGLNTTNALTVTNLTSQNGFSLQSLSINYFTPSGSNTLTLNLEGFVKQTLKVDTLYARGTNRVVEDIFGGASSWNVIGAGFIGVTNAAPIVAEGSINISFLKNLPQ